MTKTTALKRKIVLLEFHWRSMAAVVYMIICLTDFVVMPIYREHAYAQMPVQEMVRLSMHMDSSASQIEALKTLKQDRAWVPITDEVFHLSFGAILGVSALPTNRRRKVAKPGEEPLPEGTEQ